MSEEHVEISLTRSEALVLFEWLANDETGQRKVPDKAEDTVLLRIEAQLESKLVEIVKPDYRNLVDAAKCRIVG
jgi:hypothetical protein